MKIWNIKPERMKFDWGEMDAIALGERGRGRVYTIIPFHAPLNPNADDYEIGQTKTGKPKIIRTGKPSPGWLARICTYCTYTRGTIGKIFQIAGEAELIADGWGAFGDAGRLGGWQDVLIKAMPGAIIKVKPSGGSHKVQNYYLVFKEDGVDKVLEDEWSVYCEANNITVEEGEKV